MEDRQRMSLAGKSVALEMMASVNKFIANAVVQRVSSTIPGLK